MTARDWEVQVVEDGRAGSILYREPGRELRFWWEFGGGDAVAMISVGTSDEWTRNHPWAGTRRAEIIERVTREVIRQKAPGCVGTLDDRGWITLMPSGPAAGGPGSRGTPSRRGWSDPSAATVSREGGAADSAAARHLAVSSRKASIVGIAAIVLVALSAIAWLGRSTLQIQTTGSPVGRSMRSGSTIITLMTRLEPYVPSLHRDAGKDRYRVGILLHDVRSDGHRFIELGSGRDASSSVNVKLEAVDGTRVWVQTPPMMLVDLATDRVTSAEELERTPSLAPPKRPFRMSDLAKGDDIVERMQSPAEVSGDSIFHPGFVRVEIDGAILSLVGGARLRLHETKRYGAGTVVASAIGPSGETLWSVDTGIGKLVDILPDAEWPALVGERPRIPDKLSEPILVTIDARSGTMRTHSLWLR